MDAAQQDQRRLPPQGALSPSARASTGWVAFRIDRERRVRSMEGPHAPDLGWIEGSRISDIADPESLNRTIERLHQKQPGEPAVSADVELLSPEGDKHVFEVVFLAAGNDPDDDFLIRGIARDVTHERELQSMFRTLAQDSPIGVYIVQNGRFAFVNPSMERLTGYSFDELVGMRSILLIHEDDRERVRAAAIAMLKGRRSAPYDYRSVCANRGTRWVLETVSSVMWQGRRAVLGNYMDYSAQKELEWQLRDTTLRDQLTGLPNRRFLKQRMDELLAEPGTPVAVFFLDLDGFKDVNDSYGHRAGDLLLQAVAARASSVLRGGDTFARIGGDEFVALVHPPCDRGSIVAVAERLLAAMSQPFELEGAIVNIGVSIGIALGVGGHDRVDGLLERADQAMYEAKLGGKGRFVINEEGERRVA